MAKINILEPSVFNRIAAGEVVDRPASVIKELVENSLDAGATSIIVEIKRGGKDLMKVSDNGCGIPKTELPNAILPHATSKICNADDLDHIGTLGFRGEALPSIAAVADIKIISKTVGQPLGACLTVNGDGTQVSDVGSPDGTYFTVENLFSRIPARAKFLEKDIQEESAITDIISRLILSHPNISFRYVADGKKIYQSYGQGLVDALTCIYGIDVMSHVIEVHTSRFDMKLSGYIGRESFSKANRTYQTLIVNGRYAQNQTVSNAVYYAYADRLMKRQFPFYVLYLELPTDLVDVNVHPNKLEVRFVNKNAVYSLVNTTVAQYLSTGYEIPSGIDDHKSAQHSGGVNFMSAAESVKFDSRRTPDKILSRSSVADSGVIMSKVAQIMSQNPEYSQSKTNGPGSAILSAVKQSESMSTQDNADEMDMLPKDKDAFISEPRAQQAEFVLENPYKIVGVAFDTYLILQLKNALFWIDQHAAHERLLYDRIKASRESTDIQPLLVPYIFNVNAQEDAFLTQNLDAINSCGIEIEGFGKYCYKISALPSLLTEMSLSEFVREILRDTVNAYAKNNSDLIKDRLMQEACKAAAKGGDALTDSELRLIMQGIVDTNATLMCPHGRPIAVKIDRSAVEKWFKRIVT